MLKFAWCWAWIFVAACGDDPKKPVPAPFGLDTRPSNTTCIAPDRPVIDTGVALQRQWPNITFDDPIYLTQAPGDDTQWYVVEKGGTIRKFATSATTNPQVSNFASVNVAVDSEAGLLGFAFHPNWQINRDAYLSYTRTQKADDPEPPTCRNPISGFPFTSVIARFHSADGGATLDPTADEILKVGQPYTNHNGGHIQFGKDGMLYFGLGDGGSGFDPCGSGQSLNTLLGKILRIDVNAPPGRYLIPSDNPFARSEIWAYGFRNPWRWSFDRDTGDLWVGDVGQGKWEEIDRVEKGGNYGWKTCEGFHRTDSTDQLCATPGLRDPVV